MSSRGKPSWISKTSCNTSPLNVHERRRYLLKIRKACERTADWPESGRRREEIAPGVRSALVKPYVILYRCAVGQVQVLRILHARRDIVRVFQGTPSQA